MEFELKAVENIYKKMYKNSMISSMELELGLKTWRQNLQLPKLATAEDERARLYSLLRKTDNVRYYVFKLVSDSLGIGYEDVGIIQGSSINPYDPVMRCTYYLTVNEDIDDLNNYDLGVLRASVERIHEAWCVLGNFIIGLGVMTWDEVTEVLGDNAYYLGYELLGLTGNLEATLSVTTGEDTNQSKFDLMNMSENPSYALGCKGTNQLKVYIYGGIVNFFGTAYSVADQLSPTFTATGTKLLYAYVNTGAINFAITDYPVDNILFINDVLTLPVCTVTFDGETAITDDMIFDCRL